jgi:hypothetical protein
MVGVRGEFATGSQGECSSRLVGRRYAIRRRVACHREFRALLATWYDEQNKRPDPGWKFTVMSAEQERSVRQSQRLHAVQLGTMEAASQINRELLGKQTPSFPRGAECDPASWHAASGSSGAWRGACPGFRSPTTVRAAPGPQNPTSPQLPLSPNTNENDM